MASGTMNLGDVQAFIQYTRMFTQPLTQLASMANLLQSGVASAERVFEVLDEQEQVPEEASSLNPTCGRVAFEHVWFSYDADTAKGDDPLEPPKKTKKPLITDLCRGRRCDPTLGWFCRTPGSSMGPSGRTLHTDGRPRLRRRFTRLPRQHTLIGSCTHYRTAMRRS